MDFILIILSLMLVKLLSVDLSFFLGERGYNFIIFCNRYSVHTLEKGFTEGLQAFLDRMPNEEKRKYNIEDLKVIISPDLKLTIKTLMEFWIDSSVSKLLGFEDGQLVIEYNDTKSAKDYPN